MIIIFPTMDITMPIIIYLINILILFTTTLMMIILKNRLKRERQ